jgi:hypothetical protein
MAQRPKGGNRQPDLIPRSKQSTISLPDDHPMVILTDTVDWTEMETRAEKIRAKKLKNAAGRPPRLRATLGALTLMALGSRPYREDSRYRSVIVDEAQDFGADALRLVRAIAGPEHPDDLFLVGDAHQRIYGRPVTLSSCGIQVRGRRSQTLRSTTGPPAPSADGRSGCWPASRWMTWMTARPTGAVTSPSERAPRPRSTASTAPLPRRRVWWRW